MSKPLLCVTVTAPTTAELRRRRDEVGRRRPDRAASRLGERSRRRRRAGRPAASGHRHVPPGVGRRRASRAPKKSGGAFWPMRWRSAPSTSTSNRARASTISWRSPAAGVWCCRTTISTACRPILPGLVQAMRSTGAEVVKVAVKTEWLSDCVPLLDLGAQVGTSGRVCRDRHGPVRPRDARACRPFRIDVDVCRIGPRGRPAVGGDALERLPVPFADRRDRRVRPRRVARFALGLAGDAQRRVRGDTARCGLPAAARRERRRLRHVRPRARRQGRQRDDPAQGHAVRARRRNRRASRGASVPSTRFASSTVDGWAATPTSRDFSQPLVERGRR